MEVNSIVALLSSNQIDLARKELNKIKKSNNHYSLKGIETYLFLKDSKFDEALKQIGSPTDLYSIFLKCHILFTQSKPFIFVNYFYSRETARGSLDIGRQCP
jgi:hypothetical protein